MNFLQLTLKQMRQRALSTWLTLLSVMLGVGLAVAIMIFQREGQKLFGQTDYGYDVIVGPKGSPTQLVLNTVYHLDQSPGNIPYAIYDNLAKPRPHALVRSAIPYVVGDDYKGFRVVGTSDEMFLTTHEGKLHARESLAPNLERVKTEAGKWPEREKYIQRHLTEEADEPHHYVHPLYRQLMPFTNDTKELQAAADSVRGDYWRIFQPRFNRNLEFSAGRPFHPQKFEAVLGSEVARQTGLHVGSYLQVAHGGTSKEHSEKWHVVGVLQPTRTAMDRIILIPLISFYAIDEHEEGLEDIFKFQQMRDAALSGRPNPAAPTPPKSEDPDHHDDEKKKPADAPGELLVEKHDEHEGHDEHDHAYHLNDDGTIHLHVDREKWIVSAILVRTRGGHQAGTLVWNLRNGPDAQGVFPSLVMYEFYKNFLDTSTRLLLLISILVTVVAAVSILVSIYNSVSARLKEIAILRALGATRTRVLLLICLEAALVGLLGGAMGILAGHLLAAGGSLFLRQLLGEGIHWLSTSRWEWLYLLIVVALAVVAGLVPALKAYRTPVATNLVGV